MIEIQGKGGPMRSISSMAILLGTALLMGTFAGCANSSEHEPGSFDESDPTPPPAPLEFPGFPLEPIVVYELDADDHFVYETIFENDDDGKIGCSLSRNSPKIYIAQYDRYGLVWEKNYEFDFSDGKASIEIPLEGTPPFIIGGDRSFCSSTQGGTSLEGVKQGSSLYRAPGFSLDEFGNTLNREIISLHIPIGKSRQQGSWISDTYDWRLVQVWLESREGASNGNLSFHNEKGDLIRKFSFSLLGPASVEGGSTLLYPGTYTVELELARPATEPTAWTLGLQTHRFGEGVCRLDIEWGICENDG